MAERIPKGEGATIAMIARDYANMGTAEAEMASQAAGELTEYISKGRPEEGLGQTDIDETRERLLAVYKNDPEMVATINAAFSQSFSDMNEIEW